MTNEDNIIEIDLFHIFEVLINKLWIIVLSIIICGCACFSYAFYLVTPKYESSTMFYVNNNNLNIGSASFSISNADISASKSLVDTYIVILKTRNTLNAVIRKADLNISYEDLSEMISASTVNSTEIFKVTVTSSDPKLAYIIANAIDEVLPDKISEIVTGSGARVVDYAIVSTKKVSPSLTKYTAIGCLVGMLVSCAVIIIVDLMDDTIKDDTYLLNTYEDIAILSNIPDINGKPSNKYSRKYYKGYYYYKNYDRYGYGYESKNNEVDNKETENK